MTVTHFEQGFDVCFLTYKQDSHSGAIVTQTPKHDLDLNVFVQRHVTVAFLSATWNTFQKHRSVIKKDQFQIIDAVERLRLLHLTFEDFQWFRGHVHFICTFHPVLKDNEFDKQAVEKSCR